MNLDGEEISTLRSSNHEERNSDNEDIEMNTTPRPKTSSMYVQKEHHESQILGHQRLGV